ncbi:acetylcholinesterase-like [Amblyomma americanum]
MVVLASDWFQFDYRGALDIVWETIALGGDIIVVIVNHRLGVLGFLDASSAGASAAAGAEDVFLSLTWISEHIQAFQGDPALIVGFGFISGSYLASMDLFAEAQGRKRLFARLVLHGAAPTSLLPRAGLSSLTEIATSLECSSAAPLVDCLRRASLKSIDEATAKQPLLVFAPSCGRPLIGACDGIFAKLPKNLTGTDVLCGYNSFDGREFFDHTFVRESRQPDDPKMLFNHLLQYFSGNRSRQELPQEVQQYLKRHNKTSIHGFRELVSDMVLRCPMFELAREASARGATVHVYHSHGAHKLLEPAVMMADLIAFVKTGDVNWRKFSEQNSILLANGSSKRVLRWDSKDCELPTRLSRTVFR